MKKEKHSKDREMLVCMITITAIMGLIGVILVGLVYLFQPKYVEIETGCSQPTATFNGPVISSVHPVITVTQNKVVENQWVLLTGPGGSAAINFANITDIGYTQKLDGYVSDEGGGEVMILEPGEYTLIVAIHKGLPGEITEKDVVQTTPFTIKPCP